MEESRRRVQPVVADGYLRIENIFDLPKLGVGHDGYVFKYKEIALKYLKYDTPTRKNKNLMTFQKARFLRDEIDPEVLIAPNGLLLDDDGNYCGYYMDYVEDVTKDPSSPIYMEPSDFTPEVLHGTICGLERDVEQLNKAGVLMEDLNRGSYIFSSNFMRICDMDKFVITAKRMGLYSMNRSKANFIIAKFFLYEIQKKGIYSPEQLKVVSAWIKRCINETRFLDTTKKELEATSSETIGEYLDEKIPTILK